MVLLQKLKGFAKTKIGACVITGLMAFGIGSSTGISQADYDQAIKEKDKLIEKAEKEKDSAIDNAIKLDSKIIELETKLKKAQPYFDMQQIEKDRLAEEVEKAKKEEEKKKLEEQSVTLGNGTYLVGKDIPEGVYDLFAVKGGGNVISPRQVNVIMGVSGDENFYQREQQNVALSEGTTIELKGVTVKFVPDYGYIIKK